MVKKVKPNVITGGSAIDLGNNLFYMRGRTHKQGGIDVGKNPRTGIEVENGEIMQITPNNVRVFSAQPIFNGISPANALLMGGNPNSIFNAQELWKQEHRVNDDGTKFKDGGYTPSQEIIDYIKKTEGFRDKWYKDGNGIDTIGYGFTGSRIKKLYPNGITREQADKEFADSIAKRALILAKDTPNWDKLSQNQRDALLSYHYNVGEGSYRNGHPKLQEALTNLDWDNVMLNMDAGYNDKKNPGLRTRRDYERELFKSGINASFTGDEEKAFRDWYDRYSRSQNLDPNPDAKEHYYDYRTYWKNRTEQQKNEEWKLDNHLPDTYKLPGHPTFSTESIYSTRRTPGGTWKKVGLGPVYDEQFVDSKYTKRLKTYKNAQYKFGNGGALKIIGTNNGLIGKLIREKYLTDYANKGQMYSYPYNVKSLIKDYILSPYNYKKRFTDTGIDEKLRNDHINVPAERRALFSKYYNLNYTNFKPDDYIVESKYKPSKSSDKNAKYYTYKHDSAEDRYISFAKNNGTIKLDYGEDDNGKYISIYDIWDLAPFGNRTGNQLSGTPIEMYDRIYENDDKELYYKFKRFKETGLLKYGGVSFKLGGDDFKTVRQRKDYIPNKFQKWVQDKIGPLHYPNVIDVHGDFSRFYFGRPAKNNTFYISKYKPTKSNNPEAIYYGVKDSKFLNDLIYLYNKNKNLKKIGDSYVIDGYKARTESDKDSGYVGNNIERYYLDGDLRKKGMLPPEIGSKDYMLSDSVGALGNFTIGRGKDEKGEYLSYYDLWDVDAKTEKRGFAKPYEVYDRIYGTFDNDGTFHPNGEINPSIITEKLKYGGIHIKPSKRGTFTDAAERHNMGVQEFARTVLNNRERYSSAMVKKANFARNASKWNKKEFGGDMTKQYYITKNNVYSLGGKVEDKQVLGFDDKLGLTDNIIPSIVTDSRISPIEHITNYYKLKEFLRRRRKAPYGTEINRPQRYYENGTVYYKVGDRTFTKEEFANVYGLNINDVDTKFDFDDLTYIPKYTRNSNVPIKISPTSIDISKNQPKFNETFLSAFPNPNYSLGIADKSSPRLSELPGGTTSSVGSTPKNPYYSKLNIALAKTKNFLSSQNGADWLGLGINLAGNLASSLINRNTIKSLNYGDAPIPLSAQKLKTEINVNPQVDQIRENVAGQERLIVDNTADSRVALARRQRVRNFGTEQFQSLMGQKENMETQLINRDRLNRQGIDAQNVTQYNQWRRGAYDFENRRREMLAENAVAGINNAAEAIAGERGILARREGRNRDILDAALIAATSPHAQNIIGSEEFAKFLEQLGYTGNFSLLRKRLNIG